MTLTKRKQFVLDTNIFLTEDSSSLMSLANEHEIFITSDTKKEILDKNSKKSLDFLLSLDRVHVKDPPNPNYLKDGGEASMKNYCITFIKSFL